jgi:hypothetical protein
VTGTVDDLEDELAGESTSLAGRQPNAVWLAVGERAGGDRVAKTVTCMPV